MKTGKFWVDGWAREGAYANEPNLGEEFQFVSGLSEVIVTGTVRKILGWSDAGFKLVDAGGNEYAMENDLG